MPRENGRLSPQERALIPAIVATGGDVPEAARRAGYKSPSSAHHALARPAIAAEVVRLQTERIQNTILPLAVDALQWLLTEKTVPAGAKATAVKIALDRVYGSQDAARGKEPHEMTGEELAREIEHLRQVKADKAKPIAAELTDPGVFG